jgi:hypothetical protein
MGYTDGSVLERRSRDGSKRHGSSGYLESRPSRMRFGSVPISASGPKITKKSMHFGGTCGDSREQKRPRVVRLLEAQRFALQRMRRAHRMVGNSAKKENAVQHPGGRKAPPALERLPEGGAVQEAEVKKLTDWAYIDDADELHFDIPALLEVMGWPDTQQNRDRAVDGALIALHDLGLDDLPTRVESRPRWSG